MVVSIQNPCIITNVHYHLMHYEQVNCTSVDHFLHLLTRSSRETSQNDVWGVVRFKCTRRCDVQPIIFYDQMILTGDCLIYHHNGWGRD